MERERQRAQDRLRSAALDYYLDRRSRSVMDEPSGAEAQQIPVNVYETEEDVVIVAPMPGVEDDNIDIEVLGSTVTLRSALRGPGQADRDYLVHEWTYGPYIRTVELPMEVDAEHANASHGNGVLVLSLPKVRRSRSVRVSLRSSTSTHSSGHSGHHTSREGLPDQTAS